MIATPAQLFYRALSAVPFLPSARRYNISLSHERKFLWFRVAKVGTRTIVRCLRQGGVLRRRGPDSNLHYAPNLYRDYFKFAFVRNPWDRLISCWLDKVVRSNAFGLAPDALERCRRLDGFLDHVAGLDLQACDRHLALQSSLIDLNNVDFIGRMERFEDDLRTVLARIGVEHVEIGRANATDERQPYAAYYDAAAREKAFRLYEKDIRLFGYDF
ncbi:sulfotransferase family protein [Amphiplicatus metriothermophilus]|uniref:Sulfotransferase family protein n=1 Tax=Amphiplicatus metriothermophilus TaxID=1519374 RepID=A0A239PJM4_9PROT|nr:sulfotransferase family protein [Amphiplicatus metriothermophilus]MBB5517906.1 hypothetical protein [Amphiplicatus metriothermophilus]SNT67760.1 Sulfotransferase family protein [Amphiplicatus metriothermophilus]